MRLRRSGGGARALSASLFLITFPVFAQGHSLSGLKAASIADWLSPGDLLSCLEEWKAVPREELDLAGRSFIRAVDGSGAPLPFAAYRLVSEGKETGRGLAYADGCFPLPGAFAEGASARVELAPLRVELSCRGAATVTSVDPVAGTARLEGAGGLPSPLACDIVFVVDATVSMAPRLASVKAAIRGSLGMIRASPSAPRLRVGLVLFRDADDEYLVRKRELSPDIDSFLSFLEEAGAEGGGDIEEALGAGLSAAVEDMDFGRDAAKIVFAFTDAPPKTGERAAGSYGEACRAAAARGVRIFPVALGGMARAGQYALRQVAAYTRASYIAADSGSAPSLAPAGGAVLGDLEPLMSRIVLADCAAAGGSGASGDPAFALLDSVQARMAAAISYPETARLRSLEGVVRLRLAVGGDGRLAGLSVASSSSSEILDRAALSLARSAFPLRNPAGGDVELEIAVRYELEKP